MTDGKKLDSLEDVRIGEKRITEMTMDELSELSEDELEEVAGGGWAVTVGGNINATGSLVGRDIATGGATDPIERPDPIRFSFSKGRLRRGR